MSILECRSLYKSYKKGLFVLNNMNLQISEGKIIGLLGPNGCGKSTLIKTVAGVLLPTAGEVLVDGIPVGEETKALVSYLPERTYLTSSRKVSDLLEYFNDFYNDFDSKRALDMLETLHIDVNATDRDQEAELERLLSLGARPADIGQTGHEQWHVLADPEGNEFCLLKAQLDPL